MLQLIFIIIIFYFENVTFFHTKLRSDICGLPPGRQLNLWRHLTRFNSTTSGKIAKTYPPGVETDQVWMSVSVRRHESQITDGTCSLTTGIGDCNRWIFRWIFNITRRDKNSRYRIANGIASQFATHFWANATHFHFCIALIALHCDTLETTGFQYIPAKEIPAKEV